jgi:ubiquinone/menaquinone biosynthesis C-methylase UbiE
MTGGTQAPASPAQAYQEYFGPAIFEPLAARVLEAAPPGRARRVLDVACGTGILTRGLAAAIGAGGEVTGVDVNPGMLEVARARPGAGAAVDYRHGDATALDEPDASYDAVYCQQGLQFFPDRAAGVREMRRVLRDRGYAVVVVWQALDEHPLYAALADAEEPHLAALGAEIGRAELEAPFSLGESGELEALLREAGFAAVRTQVASVEAIFPDADHFVDRMEFAYAAVVPRLAADPEAFTDFLEAIRSDTADIVADHRRGDAVVVPMRTTIAVAR